VSVVLGGTARKLLTKIGMLPSGSVISSSKMVAEAKVYQSISAPGRRIRRCKKPKKTGDSVPTGACQRQPRGGVFMLSNLTKYCLAIAASCASEG
jgi:hypothetical protein